MGMGWVNIGGKAGGEHRENVVAIVLLLRIGVNPSLNCEVVRLRGKSAPGTGTMCCPKFHLMVPPFHNRRYRWSHQAVQITPIVDAEHELFMAVASLAWAVLKAHGWRDSVGQTCRYCLQTPNGHPTPQL